MRLALESDVVRCDGTERPAWTVLIADICILGEFTTDYGPFLEDWHLALVRGDGSWEECLINDSSLDLLKDLGLRLGADSLVPMLWGSACCTSRIIWPPSADEPLFEFRVSDSESWEQRLRCAMAGKTNPEGRVLSPQALALLHKTPK